MNFPSSIAEQDAVMLTFRFSPPDPLRPAAVGSSCCESTVRLTEVSVATVMRMSCCSSALVQLVVTVSCFIKKGDSAGLVMVVVRTGSMVVGVCGANTGANGILSLLVMGRRGKVGVWMFASQSSSNCRHSCRAMKLFTSISQVFAFG